MTWIWEHERWPVLHWDDHVLARPLAQVSREQGRLLGRMDGLGFDLRREAHLRTLTEDVVKSSEIEGENLDTEQVLSSIARLGMDAGGPMEVVSGRGAEREFITKRLRPSAFPRRSKSFSAGSKIPARPISCSPPGGSDDT